LRRLVFLEGTKNVCNALGRDGGVEVGRDGGVENDRLLPNQLGLSREYLRETSLFVYRELACRYLVEIVHVLSSTSSEVQNICATQGENGRKGREQNGGSLERDYSLYEDQLLNMDYLAELRLVVGKYVHLASSHDEYTGGGGGDREDRSTHNAFKFEALRMQKLVHILMSRLTKQHIFIHEYMRERLMEKKGREGGNEQETDYFNHSIRGVDDVDFGISGEMGEKNGVGQALVRKFIRSLSLQKSPNFSKSCGTLEVATSYFSTASASFPSSHYPRLSACAKFLYFSVRQSLPELLKLSCELVRLHISIHTLPHIRPHILIHILIHMYTYAYI